MLQILIGEKRQIENSFLRLFDLRACSQFRLMADCVKTPKLSEFFTVFFDLKLRRHFEVGFCKFKSVPMNDYITK